MKLSETLGLGREKVNAAPLCFGIEKLIEEVRKRDGYLK